MKKETLGFDLALGLLIATMVLPTIYVLALVLGPTGFGVLTPPHDNPLIGEAAMVPQVTATLDEARVTMEQLPQDRWVEDAGGTRDKDGLILAELTGPFTGEIGLPGLNDRLGFRMAYLAWQISGPLMFVVGAWLLYRLVHSAKRGEAFTAANARRLSALAALVMLGGSLVSWGGGLLQMWLLDQSGARDVVLTGTSMSFAPLAIGLVLFILAEVWRRGVQLEADVHGLI